MLNVDVIMVISLLIMIIYFFPREPYKHKARKKVYTKNLKYTLKNNFLRHDCETQQMDYQHMLRINVIFAYYQTIGQEIYI